MGKKSGILVRGAGRNLGGEKRKDGQKGGGEKVGRGEGKGTLQTRRGGR